jgi:pyridoxine 5-phosphate synthase
MMPSAPQGARIRLHVNIDHVATLRNARGGTYPDPVEAARVSLAAGADGITAHLREDRRHIHDDDVRRLRALVAVTFNFEMAATEEMVSIALRTKPDIVTLVPERREERTTEGGLDVVAGGEVLRGRIARLADAGVQVSLFIAADEAQIAETTRTRARQIELHTGEYAHAALAAATAPEGGDERRTLAREARRIAEAARGAKGEGLEVAAGHGLTRANVRAVACVPEIIELNIGHAIVCDAVFMSLGGAVRAMRDAMDGARQGA